MVHPVIRSTKFQVEAQIMHGMVTQQMMQIASSGRPSSSLPLLPSHLGLASTQPLSENLSRPSENQLLIASKNPRIFQQATLPHQVVAQLQYQLSSLPQSQVLQATVAEKAGFAMVPSRCPQVFGNPHAQPSLLVATAVASLAHNPQLALSNMSLQQPDSSSGQLPVSTPALQGLSGMNTQSLGVGLEDQTLKRGRPLEMISYPSKSQRLEDGSQATQIVNNSSADIQILGTGLGPGSKVLADSVLHSQKLQLPPEAESILLQQVLILTTEQLSLLPPEQQQQVLQLQKMLSASK